MVANRIRDIRQQKDLSQAALGRLIGRSKSVISRIEDGETKLDLEIARRIAEKLDVSLAEVLGIEQPPGSGFAEDEAVRYVAADGDPFKGLETPHRFLITVKTTALDKHGIRRGDLALVDNSAAAVKAITPLAACYVQYHPEPDNHAHSVTLLRLFVPPSKLITNSVKDDRPSLDLDTDDAHIMGVVVWTGRSHT